MMANPPSAVELKAALAELAASYSGDERIEPHIRSLYETTCARCGQTLSAEYFIWEHGNPSPSTRSYTCPNCGDAGEHPCTARDIELSGRFSSSGLHRARALERVVASTDPDRIHVEQALSVYTPRALYALITIINKIEGLNITSHGQKHLAALSLYAFDQANVMWRTASHKERRRQLTIPRHYRENNIWFAFEEGVKLWSASNPAASKSPIHVTIWPDLPPSTGGICIYEGRFISLVESLKEIKISSVCTAIPRPNQAFWTLSALWAGWLWGRDAVGPFKSVLRRQRYDWAWHTTALYSVFKPLVGILEPATIILGLIGEAEPGFIGAALIAAHMAGCYLENVAIRAEEEQAQVIWKVENSHEFLQKGVVRSQSAVESAKRYLELCAEPESYLTTISAAFTGIIRSWGLSSQSHAEEPERSSNAGNGTNDTSGQPESSPSLNYSSTYNFAREALSYRSGFLRYNLQEASNVEASTKPLISQSSLFSLDMGKTVDDEVESEFPENPPVEGEAFSEKERPTRSSDISTSALVWLRDCDRVNHSPISDRYELTLVSYLIDHPGSTFQDIDEFVCKTYPGLLTPPLEFIQLCVDSYATLSSAGADSWYLRPEDDLRERQSDCERAGLTIRQIGERLGYITVDRSVNESRTNVTWLDNTAQPAYTFYPTITAAIGEIVLYGEMPHVRSYIVIPGSRANLLVYKLRRDLRLAKAFNPSQGNWRFLKFRHLRSLVNSPILTRENLDQLISLDPITYSAPQLWLI
jgi:hypothetical protein